MQLFFSPSTGGFYSDARFGARTMLVPDLHWVHDEAKPEEEAPLVEVPNPACKLPADAVPITAELHAALMQAQAAGKVIAPGPDGQPQAIDKPAPTGDELKRVATRMVQAHLDAQARAMGYDDIATAITYADEPAVPQYQAEGQALRAWRSKCWAACFAALPTAKTTADVIAALPAYA
jgi:hypothetical protein